MTLRQRIRRLLPLFVRMWLARRHADRVYDRVAGDDPTSADYGPGEAWALKDTDL